MFRRNAILPLVAMALALAGCPDVEQDPPKDRIVLAGDLQNRVIPLPNDLALLAAASLPDAAGVQKELLVSFVNTGGFPSDQEVAVTVPIRMLTKDATGAFSVPGPAPRLDLTTVNASTVALVHMNAAGGPAAVAFEAAEAPATCGTPPGPTYACTNLGLRRAPAADGSRRWDPGARYVVAVRGGANGVKTPEGEIVGADTGIALIAANKDLSLPQNQPVPLTPAQVQQLETGFAPGLNLGLRDFFNERLDWTSPAPGLWVPAPSASTPSAFEAVASVFPFQEIASIQTFETQPAAPVHPLTDTGSGQIPLPSDFLLDPSRLSPAGRPLVRNVPSFGPAAAGLATLDGFSTTGMILVPLTGPVQASTITGSSVLVFELPPAGAPPGTPPRRLLDVASSPANAEYLAQPPALNRDVGGTQVATAIGLQPGVAVPTQAGIITVPPLKEKARYAVVVTDRVKDLQGNGLARSTLANILFTFQGPLVANGQSQIPGVSSGDAAGLQALRDGLAPLLDNLGALSGDAGLSRGNVVMAYTISTQTVTDTSVLLSAAPYDPNADGNPADNVVFTTTSQPTALDLAALGLEPLRDQLFPDVDAFLETTFLSLDATDPATGALNPNVAAWAPVQLPALVVVPNVAVTCTPTAPCPLPLVVWHHGLSGGRLQMLTVANSLAARGFLTVAIDAPLHGDRAFCSENADCTVTGTDVGVCTPDQARAGQGDDVPPGTCTTGHLKGFNLTTVASANYFVSGNFFRVRDTIRQDLLDHAALVLAVARPPAPFPQPAANPLANELLERGIVVDPTAVHFEGNSLGSIVGTQMMAANPRFDRAVLTVPGGTLVDVFTNAPAFTDAVNELFLGLGIDRSQIPTDPAVAARYLQTLIVAKWILDPADPVNYAANVPTKLASPLTGLLGAAAHATTLAYGQLARCDQVVPNATTVAGGVPLPFGDLVLDLAGVPTTLYSTAGDGCVPHGVLVDTLLTPVSGSGTIGDQVRAHAAEFLVSGTPAAATVTLP